MEWNWYELDFNENNVILTSISQNDIILNAQNNQILKQQNVNFKYKHGKNVPWMSFWMLFSQCPKNKIWNFFT